jgi:hypothetical protein
MIASLWAAYLVGNYPVLPMVYEPLLLLEMAEDVNVSWNLQITSTQMGAWARDGRSGDSAGLMQMRTEGQSIFGREHRVRQLHRRRLGRRCGAGERATNRVRGRRRRRV